MNGFKVCIQEAHLHDLFMVQIFIDDGWFMRAACLDLMFWRSSFIILMEK